MANRGGDSFASTEAPVSATPEHSEAIVRLFAQHQRWLHGYLTALLGNASDAEDVFQEVCVVMWREHQKFELGTNFVGWLSVIAYHQVQKIWRARKRRHRFLDEETVALLSRELPRRYEVMEARRHALPECLGKLRSIDRELIRLCYGDRGTTAKQVASDLGRPENTVYKALNRIRRSLHECISRAVSAEELA